MAGQSTLLTTPKAPIICILHPRKLSLRASFSLRRTPTPFSFPGGSTSRRAVPSTRAANTAGQSTTAQPQATTSRYNTASGGNISGSATYLAELHIENYALVAEQQLHLEPGLNVITGESGSGKSVLIDALGQLLGDQASEGTVRPPASQATIEGTFRLAGAHRQPMRSLLLSLGLPRYAVPQELESLVLRREIAASSGVRTRSYLNGAKVTRKVLKEVARALVDVNGQHSAYAMQKAAAQQAMLDRLGPGLTSSSQLLHKSLRELQEARSRLATFETMGSESVRQRMHQLVDDVTAARVEPGEDVSLRKQLRELDSRRDAAERCRLVSVAVGSDASGDGMLSAMDTVKQHVQTLLRKEERLRDAAQEAAAGKKDGESSDDDSALDLDEGNDGDAILMLQGAIESLMVARHALQDAESTVEQYARKYRFGQAAYDSLAERLQLVERVMKQHDAVSADQLVEEAEAAVLALDNYYMNKERQEEMEAEVVRMEERLIQEAVALSRRRRAAAERLTRAVQTMLCELAMEGARFDVQLRWTPAASSKNAVMVPRECAPEGTDCDGPYLMRPHGLDSVEFFFAAGPDEPLRPLSAVASGGEAARLMLAIKAAPSLLRGSNADGCGEDESLFEEEVLADDEGDGADKFGAAPSITIFDEIDSSIGSRLGMPVGRILRRMAGVQGTGAAQVLCVSHLPQVAAYGQYHICVRKDVERAGGRVSTRFDVLSSEEDRVAEVAAMLGLTREAAEELLRMSSQDGLVGAFE